ncbi:WD40-repeat-containing domain protein [Lipomyces japonicus]|uniref:WD40-repeat-containing domain protein n=1 Tax=Lipomyces japonicus TaxID=56871 RepID=UPI0034CD080A
MTTQRAIVPRYAHPAGLTRLAYSSDGVFLLTVGSNRLIRKFTVDSEDEPATIEHHEDSIVGLATSKHQFVTCSEDGTASLFSLDGKADETMIMRQSLPIRDVAFSPDGEWIGIAGDETVVKLVNSVNPLRTISLPGHSAAVRHVSFHPNGVLVATSSADGTLRIFDISTEEPQLIKTIDSIAPVVDAVDDACTKIAWHPDGRVFATQNKTRDIVTISRANWNNERSFASGHMGIINDYEWSPNGAYLATSGSDGKILIWDTKNQSIVATHFYKNTLNLRWHPSKNVISFTTTLGQLYTLAEAITANRYEPPFGRTVHAAPLINDPTAGVVATSRTRQATNDDHSLFEDEVDNWIEDDDGQGYRIPDYDDQHGDDVYYDGPPSKRQRQFANTSTTTTTAVQHLPFQPGSTQWKNNRRYLALNSIGYIWTVEQDLNNTVTVSFFDRGLHREYHFADHVMFDKASLTADAALFALTGGDDNSNNSKVAGRVFFRTHESLVDAWEIVFPDGEYVSAIALSDTTAVVCTSAGYVRVYSLNGGTPLRVYRQLANPIVTCAAFDDFVFIIRNTGHGQMSYSIENVKFDETLQKNDVVDATELVSVFWSEEGDPYVFDSRGVLLVLLHWRQPLQAKWVPLLDTGALAKARENKDEKFWPLGISHGKFNCIILKGGEKHPYIPLPISSELDLKMPVVIAAADGESGSSAEGAGLEEQYMRETVNLQLFRDAAAGVNVDVNDDNNEINRKELEIDKVLLQVLAHACKNGKDGKARGIISLIHKDQALAAAVRIAQRYDMTILAERITREIERRQEAVDEDNDEKFV